MTRGLQPYMLHPNPAAPAEMRLKHPVRPDRNLDPFPATELRYSGPLAAVCSSAAYDASLADCINSATAP